MSYSSLGVVAVQRKVFKYRAFQSRLALHPHRHIQIRNLPWVPLAYRKGGRPAIVGNAAAKVRPTPKTRSTPRSRALLGRRAKKGQTHRVSSESTKQHSKFIQGSLSFTIQSHKENLLKLQKELDFSIIRYKQSLSALTPPTEGTGTQTTTTPAEGQQGSSHQITALLPKLSALHSGHAPDSWKHVEETEENYRQMGALVSDMIGIAIKIQNLMLKEISQVNDNKQEEHILYFYCSLAEQLLLTLIEMQSDRLAFVTTAGERDPTTNLGGSSKLSWFGWLKHRIMDSKVSPEDVAEENKGPLAHEDPLCSPKLEHFQCLADIVLRTMRQELRDPQQSAFRKIRRAQRLQQILARAPHNVEPDNNTIQTLMSAYALVGSYESARACEKLANKYPDKHYDLFGSVLHAYFTAAKSSPRSQDRSRAAIRADELVREKWMEEGGPIEYEEKKFVHCTKAMLCLNAVGGEAIPDINVRADTLANMCVGRENLEEVFRNGNLEVLWKIAPSNLTIPLLNCLVLIYASSRDSSRVNLAKKLLQILLEDSDFQESTDVPYPDVRTCKAVLAGLVGINDRRIRWTRVASPSDEQAKAPNHLEDSSLSCLEYGVQLLDQMFARSQCWPDQSYFHSLLRLLLMARPRGTGETADMLLSKMYIRECFGKLSGNRTMVTRKTYHYVLRAWLASAEAGDAQAARRALELVEFMEAQSLPLLSPADSSNSDGPTVYRAPTLPDRSTYQLLLKTCGSIKVESEKEDALDIALLVDKKMKKRGITPTSDTYSLLFACCANLLPENSKRRHNVTRQLLEDARQQGSVNEDVLAKAKNGDSDGNGAKGRASSGGGLLSDLV